MLKLISVSRSLLYQKNELDFWQNNVNKLKGPPIWFESGATCSDSDYGGYSVEVGP